MATLRAAVVALIVLVIATLGLPAAAYAAPADRAAVAEARAAVQSISGQVAAAERELDRLTVDAEAAAGQTLAAQTALATAQTESVAAAAALTVAQEAVTEARAGVATLGRDSYVGLTDAYGDMRLLLDADSPTELLERAATLQRLGHERVEVLRRLTHAETAQAEAARAAEAAVAERDQRAREAAEAEAAASARLAGAQQRLDSVTAEKAALEVQLRDAEVRVLALQGVRNPPAVQARREAVREVVATAPTVRVDPPPAATADRRGGGGIAPTTGRVTSCYGMRWGRLHAGIDIAAPIGTPIYAPEGGVAVLAGPASGFGQAVALRHGDGTVTLYGHVNRMFVSVGQSVGAGERIAEVGNRGASTGPHLHFEVHRGGGLYVNRTNPVPWLAAHGVSLGRC